MGDYRLSSRNTSTGNTVADDVTMHLWNPSASISLYVKEIRAIRSTSNANVDVRVQRTLTIGTPIQTNIADIDSDADQLVAPASGARIGIGKFTVLPTLDTSVLTRLAWEDVDGSGFLAFFAQPIRVPPGTGLGLVMDTTVTASGLIETMFWWSE